MTYITHIIYTTYITYITHIIYITHVTYITHTIKLIFKVYKKNNKTFFINFFSLYKNDK